jgi:hypothetical protein
MMEGQGPSLSRYEFSDDQAFLRIRWAPGAIIDAEDIKSTIAAVTAASPHGKRPLLVHIGTVEQITAEAKQLLIEDTCSTRTAVVGVDEVGRVITAFNYRSATASQYFLDEDEAIAWLMEKPGPVGVPASTDPFTAELRGGVLWIHCDSSTDVDTSVITAIIDRTVELSPTVRPPMLIRLNHLISITDEALDTLAAELKVTALAVVGAEAEDAVITAYYKQRHSPPYPTQHFTTVSDAQHWLINCSQPKDPHRSETVVRPGPSGTPRSI